MSMALRSKYCHISTAGASALMHGKSARFVVHQHKTGRTHFDLRIVHNGVLRSWSLLKEPPCRNGERRLAIERESFTEDSIDSKNFEEQAFGMGRVSSWDQGELEMELASPRLLILTFTGAKLSGKYEFRRMRWYPGNRWLLTKLRLPPTRQNRS
jgi:bifunctional non-homologous end joining protein LigD